jgi:uncharacterized membrane protein
MTISHPLFVSFLLVMACGMALLSPVLGVGQAALLSFDAGAVAFIAAAIVRLHAATPSMLRQNAARNDAGRLLALAVSAILLMVILVAVALELGTRQEVSSPRIALAVGTLLVGWTFGNLAFALHYTHVFYDQVCGGGDRGGLVYPGTDEPDFWDFCYFSFVLGMTFQVSDVQIVDRRVRRIATMHGIFAFLFNIGVVALTVNIVGTAL